MADLEYPVNRSDANPPEEVNPWKEHVIENEPTHKEPACIPSPGDIPKENEHPLQDVRNRMNEAGKRAIREKASLPAELSRGESDQVFDGLKRAIVRGE